MDSMKQSGTRHIGCGILFDLSAIDLKESEVLVFRSEVELCEEDAVSAMEELSKTAERPVIVISGGMSLEGLSDEDLLHFGLARIKQD